MCAMQYYAWVPCAGYGNLETQVAVTDDLRRLVTDLWVMFLRLMELDPTKFNRSLQSFKKARHHVAQGPRRQYNLDSA